MIYHIYYPSGVMFIVEGTFCTMLSPVTSPEHEGFIPAVIDINNPNQISVLDPRAIIYDGDKVVFNPRRSILAIPVWTSDWLQKNPKWSVGSPKSKKCRYMGKLVDGRYII